MLQNYHSCVFVLLQVRHPLSVVSTLYHKCREYDTFWDWIHHLRGFKQIKQDQSPLVSCVCAEKVWLRLS